MYIFVVYQFDVGFCENQFSNSITLISKLLNGMVPVNEKLSKENQNAKVNLIENTYN